MRATSTALIIALAALPACRHKRRGSRPAVVARAGDLAVPAAAVAHADAADRAAVEQTLRAWATDELLARQVEASDSIARLRAQAAGRDAAVRRLLAADLALDPKAVADAVEQRAAATRLPEQVRLAHLVLPTCDGVRQALAGVPAKDFASVVLRQSTDRASAARGGELGWLEVGALPAGDADAVAKLQLGQVSEPVATTGGCHALAVLERRAARPRPIDDVRREVEASLLGEKLGAARRRKLDALGGADRTHVDFPAARTLIAGGALDDKAVLMTQGGLTLTVGEARALAGPVVAGGPDSWAMRLAEDLRLYAEAKRRGLADGEEVRAAERAVLLAAWQERVRAEHGPDSVAQADVEATYHAALGDYTEPRKVRVAALVTKDRNKAAAWAADLQKAKFSAARFEELLADSEDLTARAQHGDLGWIDARRMDVPDVLRDASLMLEQPGKTSGAIPVRGAFHVLLCTDVLPERVAPLEEAAPLIRTKLAADAAAGALTQRRSQVADSLKLDIDWGAIQRATAHKGG